MASFKSVLFAVTLLVATSSAAPKRNKLNLDIPEECRGKGFCSIKPEGYDEMEEIINKLLPPNLIAHNIGDRIGNAAPQLSPESDWHNCPYWTKTESMYSYSHQNDSKTEFIVQTKLHSQPIEFVTCANTQEIQSKSEECFQDLGLSSFGMKTSCQTSKTKRSLLVFDPDTQELKKREFEVPCCCTCKIMDSF